LLQKAKNIFSPSQVLSLDEETIRDIASETSEAKAERANCTEKLDILNKALGLLQELSRGQSQGLFSVPLLGPIMTIT
jgi:hypothetical protein